MANLTERIDNAIQEELRYDKDYITSEGWTFLEEIANGLVLEKIKENYEESQYDEVSDDDIEEYLNQVIFEYEQCYANIRYY